MTGRERFLKTLRFEQPDRPPHFEMVFELTQEAFGLKFPEWSPANAAACMALYEKIVRRFGWDALLVFRPAQDPEGVRVAKKHFGNDIAVGAIVWEGIWCFDTIKDWDQFALDLLERPDELHRRAAQFHQNAIDKIDRLTDAGADFIMLAYDVAFNAGPFISPAQFREFVTPYLARQCARVRQRGSIPMFHSDGMLMPILDQLVEAGPAAFQSVDPMAGMDIAEVKRLTYGKMALMGNVRCDYLQTGTPEQIRESAQYCLEHGVPGGGYIFSSSNTIFNGVPLASYECMLDTYRRLGGVKTIS